MPTSETDDDRAWAEAEVARLTATFCADLEDGWRGADTPPLQEEHGPAALTLLFLAKDRDVDPIVDWDFPFRAITVGPPLMGVQLDADEKRAVRALD